MSSKYGQISNKNTNHRSYPYSYRNDPDNQNISDAQLNPRAARGQRNASPFRFKDGSMLESSGLDSIQNLIESRRSNNPHPYGTKEYRSYESQQIVFLKQKLIETHNKLLRQLEFNHKLNQEGQGLEEMLKNAQRKNRQTEQKCSSLQNQLDQVRRILERNQQKTQEKYRSVEGKLQSQNKKNLQLKDELELTKNQLMETAMQKNMLQEANTEFKVELKGLTQNLVHLEQQLRNRDEKILSMNKQIRQAVQKWEKSQNLVNKLRYEVEQLNNQLHSIKSEEKQLDHLYVLEKQKNQNLQHDIADLQSYTHQLEEKVLSLQKDLEKNKQQFFWHKENKQNESKTQLQKINKLTEDLEAMTVLYKQVDRELSGLKKKPIQDAQKKRRHYEITKQFVNQLQNQQQLYGNAGSRAVGYGAGLNKTPPSGNLTKMSRDASPTAHKFVNSKNNPQTSSGYGYFQNRPNTNANSYSNLMSNKQTNGKQERRSSQEKHKKIAQLDGMLFNLNLEHKKIKTEIQRLDTNSLKTREMIVKKKKLEEELNYQEQKIKKVKQDLRILRVS